MEKDTTCIGSEQDQATNDMYYKMETEGEGIPTSLHSDALEDGDGYADENNATFQAPSPVS